MSVTPVCDINDFLAFQLGARGNRRSALGGEGKTKGMVMLPQPPPPPASACRINDFQPRIREIRVVSSKS